MKELYAGKLNCFCADCVWLCTIVVVLNLLLYWLIGECQILNDFWKCCCCLSDRRKMLVDKLIPHVHYLPRPTTILYLLPTFTCFSQIRVCRNTKCFVIIFTADVWFYLSWLVSYIYSNYWYPFHSTLCCFAISLLIVHLNSKTYLLSI